MIDQPHGKGGCRVLFCHDEALEPARWQRYVISSLILRPGLTPMKLDASAKQLSVVRSWAWCHWKIAVLDFCSAAPALPTCWKEAWKCRAQLQCRCTSSDAQMHALWNTCFWVTVQRDRKGSSWICYSKPRKFISEKGEAKLDKTGCLRYRTADTCVKNSLCKWELPV